MFPIVEAIVAQTRLVFFQNAQQLLGELTVVGEKARRWTAGFMQVMNRDRTLMSIAVNGSDAVLLAAGALFQPRPRTCPTTTVH